MALNPITIPDGSGSIELPNPASSVSPRQARLALNAAGLLSAVQTAINADTTGVLGIWWEFASTIDRNNPLLLQVAASLNPPLTSDQIDNLFIQASTL